MARTRRHRKCESRITIARRRSGQDDESVREPSRSRRLAGAAKVEAHRHHAECCKQVPHHLNHDRLVHVAVVPGCRASGRGARLGGARPPATVLRHALCECATMTATSSRPRPRGLRGMPTRASSTTASSDSSNWCANSSKASAPGADAMARVVRRTTDGARACDRPYVMRRASSSSMMMGGIDDNGGGGDDDAWH